MNLIILLGALTDVGDIYTRVLKTCTYLAMFAALIAGFRIYTRWNRGEDIEQGLLNWFFALVLVPLIIKGVDLITSGTDDLSPDWYAGLLFNDAAALVIGIGIIVAILGLIRIYMKVRNGDDGIGEFFFKWLGSLIFLMSMYGLITAII